MAESFGSGVSRTLSAVDRAFRNVVFQAGKPPLDAEFNLQDSLHDENLREFIRENMHSGFLIDPTDATSDFVTNSQWSNFFKLGLIHTGEAAPLQWANVNGWIIPVTGTEVSSDADTSNMVKLYPPPATDTRIDFVFLEVWTSLVAPNPSTTNKPSASTIYKHGNVEFGGTNITDDIEDPTIGYETTERVQVQYRIRVFGQGAGLGSSVALDVYPDGMDDPNILGQGTATTAVAGMTYTNMRETLGDNSLWRAGDGDSTNSLGTTDGYVYAIPVCAAFRRNSQPFVAVEAAGNANQNGALDRNPSAAYLSSPRDGATTLLVADLTNALDDSSTGILQIDNLVGSGLDDSHLSLTSTFLMLDDEIIGPLSSVDITVSPTTITIGAGSRGRNDTMAAPHVAGTSVLFFNTRPDNKFADEVHSTDILDLRRAVTLGDWDYQRILLHNLSMLAQNRLKSSYKQSGAGDTEGPTVVEVDYLLADGTTSVPNQTEAMDGPDGIRTIFSDSAAFQPDVTVLCDEAAPQVAGLVTSFDSTVEWDVGADFKPGGFMTDVGGFANGSTIFLHIGGDTGTEGARATFRDGTERAVRFVSPYEYWKQENTDTTTGLQHPFKIRFLNEPAMVAASSSETVTEHPGPMYPLQQYNFEKPFIVLGGILNSSCQVGTIALFNNSPAGGEFEIQLSGLDFDLAGDWYTKSGTRFANDASAVSKPVLRGQRTLYSMLTQDGKDPSGASSEVYLVLWGDNTNPENNGAFKVIGAGATADYTTNAASAADRVRVEFLSQAVAAFTLPSAGTLTAELRSQYTNVEDGTGFASGIASLAVVLTDLEGAVDITNPWAAAKLGASPISPPVISKLAIDTSLQYSPGRGAMARVPDRIFRVAAVSAGTEYLRQAPSSIDSTFPTQTGMPDNETFFDASHVSVWNRLSSLGLWAPDAPDYGGNIVVYSEQDRETECMVDNGSRTLIFRPFLNRSMTQHSTTTVGASVLYGAATYPGPLPPGGTARDGAALFTAGGLMGFEVPPEHMPRFGRQDIPYYNGDGTGTFLAGINHLFTDSVDETEPVFYIIGGEDNTGGGNLVTRMLYQTGTTSGVDYGVHSTITGPTTPAYQARLMADTTVISSDLGRGMEGIELPPGQGLARLYGVYDRRDFVAKGGDTYESDRVTPKADPASNLLRTDATKQTLFIRQGGALDITLSADDHTYVIPSNTLDITKSPSYIAGEAFDDLEYVVECEIFGFARGFINLNNFVLARRHNGQGAAVADGDVLELEGVNMTIPAAAPLNDAVYVAHNRTPYQGDPFMTRSGSTRTVTDYETRYGQIAITDAFKLASPIQQFDTSGTTIPTTTNSRALQVLAAVDFYTTLGTGKVGGNFHTGTMQDAGYTEDTARSSLRVPVASTDPRWRVLARAYSEGQKDAPSRASLKVTIIDNAQMGTAALTITQLDGTRSTLTAGVDYAIGGGAPDTCGNLYSALTDVVNGLTTTVTALYEGGTSVTITAIAPAAEGNNLIAEISKPLAMRMDVEYVHGSLQNLLVANFAGGTDIPVNAGNGNSQIGLTGMTDRLPLGILLQDSDFLCENPMDNTATAFYTSPSGVRPVQTVLPLADSLGDEYTRLVGGPGHYIGMADGGILRYAGYNATSEPTGSRAFRLYRGGGSAWVLSGDNPGGPIDWFSISLEKEMQPVLKGGVLVCKALLVRNFPEEAFTAPSTVSHGDEIQMVVLTYGLLGNGAVSTSGLNLSGVISPTGYGEGYAAADRYRLEGKPMVAGQVRTAPTIGDVALFPYDIFSNPTG